MIIRNNYIERRKHNRFKVKQGSLVEFRKLGLFKLGKARIVKSAPIINISIEGLAFHYVDQNMWSPDFNEFSISETTDKIKIDNVPFKAVSDFSLSRVATSTFLRRCGVKFGQLTPSQKTQLHYFIQDHTTEDHHTERRAGKTEGG